MRSLIDNATVTAAMRAIGNIKVENRETFDLDVAALRVMIDNLVLAENIIIGDNYKEEHTVERKKWLDYPCIKFQTIPEKLDSKLTANAAAHVWNWNLVKELGGELDGIFDELSILFRFAWRNSESFLVLKALGVENKYNSQVVAGLRDFISNNPEPLKVVRSKAKSYNEETKKVVQSITWAANRAVYYRQLAKVTGSEYIPHPLRNTFNLKCILFDNHPTTRKHKLSSKELSQITISREKYTELAAKFGSFGLSYQSCVNTFFKNLWTYCNKGDDNIFGVETFDIEMPPFLACVLKKVNQYSKPQEVLDAAMELREDKGCSALRNKLRTIYEEGDADKRNTLIREFSYELREFRIKMQAYLGYDREKVSLSAKVVSYGVTVPRCVIKPYYPFKPHLSFMRDVILELASVSTMGRLMDNLWAIRGR